jgi:hypothetical protein
MNRFAFQLRELVLCIFLMFTVFTASVVSQAVASGGAFFCCNIAAGGDECKMRVFGPAPHPLLPSHTTLHTVNCTVGTADDTQGGDAALRRCASASSQLLVTSAATAVVVPPELNAQAEGDD